MLRRRDGERETLSKQQSCASSNGDDCNASTQGAHDMTSIKEMVCYVSKTLADKPEAIEVTESTNGTSVTVELKVAPEDMGRMIGRGGRCINAMRAVARVLGSKMGKRAYLALVEE